MLNAPFADTAQSKLHDVIGFYPIEDDPWLGDIGEWAGPTAWIAYLSYFPGVRVVDASVPSSAHQKEISPMDGRIGKLSLAALAIALSLGGCATTESVERAQATADQGLAAAQKAQGSADNAAGAAERAQATADSAASAAQNASAEARAANDKVTQLAANMQQMAQQTAHLQHYHTHHSPHMLRHYQHKGHHHHTKGHHRRK